MADVVLDASALVDTLLGNELGHSVRERLAGTTLHAPSHIDAEVLSALGRLQRAGALSEAEVDQHLANLIATPLHRAAVAELVIGAWTRRHRIRLVDALYVELAVTLAAPLITTDRRLRDAPFAEVVD